MSETIRLLIVDDEELNRDMLGRRLSRNGYLVECAPSARAGLALLERTAFDLVLLDLQMPEMSGLEMLEEIRKQWNAMQLPVIMVTANANSEAVVKALDLGANDYVTKPVDLPVVLARIRTQVARRQAEKKLLDSEERYALALRGSNDGMWDWKVDTGQVFFSPRWNELMGEPAAETEGTLETWFDRIHAEDVDRVRAELDDHLKDAAAKFESEHRVRRADGQFGWVLSRGMAVRDADGRPTRMAGSLTDITEGKVADALTGLPNRVLFLDRLTRLIDHQNREPAFLFAVLFLDLDRFKNVNDSLGHHAGDELLVQAAQRIDQSLRRTDTISRMDVEAPLARIAGNTVARMGGDEFAIILSGLRHPSDATAVAERIGRLFSRPFTLAEREIFTSVSIGIIIGSPEVTTEDIVRDADTALYRAKENGRGRFEVFEPSMRQRAFARLTGETEIRRGIERHEFVVHYQPIIALTTKRVATLEALVRWQHPERGLIGPGEFIPLAEESQLIVDLGFHIFGEVCGQIRSWIDALPDGAAVPRVAVNVSARQLAQHDCAERLAQIARHHAVPTSQLEIEITETAMMLDPVESRLVLTRLREHGFRVSIDDFGTGYSSLAYLRDFPVDRLKIDRSFISQNRSGQGANNGIVRTVIDLARHLKMEVVAEGIETVEQVQQLEQMECGYGQGYFFLKPVGAQSITELLQKQADDAEAEPEAAAESAKLAS